MIKLFLLAVICLSSSVLCSADDGSQTFDYDAGPQAQCVLDTARFKLWIGSAHKINGVFMLLPGRNGDGRKLVDSTTYQALAKRWGFALMGCNLVCVPGDKDTYQIDKNGDTAKLLCATLEKLAAITKHSELATVPIFCFGTSAGGNIAAQFPNTFPERAIGCVCYIPTIGPGFPVPAKQRVPMLIAVGAQDNPRFVEQSDRFWQQGSAGVVWTLAKHKDLGHNGGFAAELGLTYAEAILTLRMVKNEDGEYQNTLQNIDMSTGWFGNLETYDVHELGDQQLPKDTVWLPNKSTARAWHQYLTTSFTAK